MNLEAHWVHLKGFSLWSWFSCIFRFTWQLNGFSLWSWFSLGFVPASKMRLRRGLGYPTQIMVPYVFTACNPTLQKKILHNDKNYQNDYLDILVLAIIVTTTTTLTWVSRKKPDINIIFSSKWVFMSTCEDKKVKTLDCSHCDKKNSAFYCDRAF